MPQVQKSLPATYYRGGTSRGIIFKKDDLPKNEDEWGDIFCGALGSPDPNGRQLDGLGTGISSLSKICVISTSAREDADVDYTFVQIGVKGGEVDYSSNCGNMSSAVGPFAVNAGMVRPESDGETVVRIFNTNTKKLIRAKFAVSGGEAVTDGSFAIDGVTGTAAKIELAFQNPAGSRTGKLLPTGNVVDEFDGVRVSCVDVGNPCVFVQAADFGVEGTILPEEADSKPNFISKMEKIRRKAAVAMGIAQDEGSTPESVPKLVIVSQPRPYKTLCGEQLTANSCDLVVRSLSGTNLHRAVQITVALATAVAATIPGSTAEAVVSKKPLLEGAITLGHASGKTVVTAKFDDQGVVTEASVFRTARRLFEGVLYLPHSS